MYMHIVYIQYTLCEVLNEVPTPFSDPFNVILLREYKGIRGNTREYMGTHRNT